MEPFYIAFSHLFEDLPPASRVDAVLSTHLLVNCIRAIIMPQPIGGGGIRKCWNPSVSLSVCPRPLAQKRCILELRLLWNTIRKSHAGSRTHRKWPKLARAYRFSATAWRAILRLLSGGSYRQQHALSAGRATPLSSL